MSTSTDARITMLLPEYDRLTKETDQYSSIEGEAGHQARAIWVEINAYLAARSCSEPLRALCLAKGFEPICGCGKKGCEGADFHDPAADKLLSSLGTIKRDASTDPSIIREMSLRTDEIRGALLNHQPWCSPNFYARIGEELKPSAARVSCPYGPTPGAADLIGPRGGTGSQVWS